MGKRLNKTQVSGALHAVQGAAYLAARSLGVSHTTIYNFLNKYPDLSAIKDFYDGETLDIAESKLRAQIMRDEAWAIKYILSTKGKKRGYVERQEELKIDLSNLSDEQVERIARGDDVLSVIAAKGTGRA